MTSSFEDRLLTELRQVVAERPAPAAGAAPRPRTRLALSGATVAAATAAVVVVATSGDNTSAAYAVDRQANGSVTVHISSLRDAAGLQQQLRADGIPATVRYLQPGTAAPCTDAPKTTASGPQSQFGTSVRGSSG